MIQSVVNVGASISTCIWLAIQSSPVSWPHRQIQPYFYFIVWLCIPILATFVSPWSCMFSLVWYMQLEYLVKCDLFSIACSTTDWWENISLVLIQTPRLNHFLTKCTYASAQTQCDEVHYPSAHTSSRNVPHTQERSLRTSNLIVSIN